MHFSDPKTYKILFISSYGLEDINFASFKHLQQILENKKTAAGFLTQGNSAGVADRRDRGADTAR
jgi:hypothetical protein